ncbi:hypothetical protein QAD02_023444 [Eretmocerus hayati]|uniref:Uncharacterized protein n=1 Tax=Eretmocerus hayati TaxID=131215 RepID=A0ACC2PW53_9HYME|nr:hypothetical protein QAD02_023444 [Eretmocerus hayati]
MVYKISLFALACTSLVVGFTVHPRVARQTDQSNPLQTFVEGFGSGSDGNGFNFGGFGGSNPASDFFQGSNQAAEGQAAGQDNATQGGGSQGNNNSFLAGLSGKGSNGLGSGLGGFGSIGGGLVQRFRNAMNNTANDEIDSVKDSWRSVKNLAHQGINTKSNITKTKVDLALMGPKFAKNLFLN